MDGGGQRAFCVLSQCPGPVEGWACAHLCVCPQGHMRHALMGVRPAGAAGWERGGGRRTWWLLLPPRGAFPAAPRGQWLSRPRKRVWRLESGCERRSPSWQPCLRAYTRAEGEGWALSSGTDRVRGHGPSWSLGSLLPGVQPCGTHAVRGWLETQEEGVNACSGWGGKRG